MYEVVHVKGVGFQVVDTTTDSVLVAFPTRKAAEIEAAYQNANAYRLAAQPEFNPYVEADAPGGLDSIQSEPDVAVGMAFEETGRVLGCDLRRVWFVKGVGTRMVNYEYAESESPWFDEAMKTQSGIAGRMTRAEFAKIVANPNVRRIDANVGDGLAILDELSDANAAIVATLDRIDADAARIPSCLMCGNDSKIDDVICDRCERVQVYAAEIGATFTGFQGRNAVMRDGNGHEFVVWAETFDAPIKPRVDSKKAAGMNGIRTLSANGYPVQIGDTVAIPTSSVGRKVQGTVIGFGSPQCGVQTAKVMVGSDPEPWTYYVSVLDVITPATRKTDVLDVYNAILIDAADYRPGRPSYADRVAYANGIEI